MNDRRSKRVSNRPEEPAAPVIVEVDTQPDVPILSEPTDNTEPSNSSSAKLNRRVSFADRVDIFSAAPPVEDIEQPHTKTSLPSAAETLVENMDSNLRMLIIKELSKDGHIQRPPSKMSSFLQHTLTALIPFLVLPRFALPYDEGSLPATNPIAEMGRIRAAARHE